MTAAPDSARPGVRQYDAAQLRKDTWTQLQANTAWLGEFARLHRDVAEPRTAVAERLETLRGLEAYWAFPGRAVVDDLETRLSRGDYDGIAQDTARIARLLSGNAYRSRSERGSDHDRSPGDDHASDALAEHAHLDRRPYFEVLVVDAATDDEHDELRERLLAVRRDEDEFRYDVVFAPTFEDAVIAVLFNRTIQSCALRYNFPFRTENRHPIFDRYLEHVTDAHLELSYGHQRNLTLAGLLKALRPELDLFLVTDTSLEEVAGNLGRSFRRVFYRHDNELELHLSILKGIRSRYETPFFDALRRYSQKPTGVFHALPVARGKSISNSHWIRDMGQFYGDSIFLAETSATSGGLDSLLQPEGPIKRAQEVAARAFGARQSFFVTNGTSTANKIVVQSLVRPDDIVLLARDCHKSHHYALMLQGARPSYLDAYPLTEYSFYGAVTLADIKRRLLDLKRRGQLDRVRMLLLTNCTFDGITYDPLRIMREVLAIKPDMIFVWDEAWFAFARFDPLLRRRTGMWAAAELSRTFRSDDYRARYASWREAFGRLDPDADATWTDHELMADPDLANVRVYVTQSTHKTLTSLRQGSMIHVWDELFERHVQDAFHEAFMTHTSTSPNYQIIASLDVGRRQVELEGYEMVQRSIGLAMQLRERIYEHPHISRHFSVLRPADLIPASHRPSGLEFYYDPAGGWARMGQAWREDEFTLDPTRVTLHIGRTGIDGDSFRHLLMDEHDIQINKTSRNTVLFMTNIGMTTGDVAYLVEVLARIADELDERIDCQSGVERRRWQERVIALTENLPPLPNFSRFHASFAAANDLEGTEGDLRHAFFLAYDGNACEHLKLGGELAAALDAGRELVSASFVIPYPPGFPILVPGQIVSAGILEYLNAVDVKEIHGYEPEHGLRVFTEDAIRRNCTSAATQPDLQLAEPKGA